MHCDDVTRELSAPAGRVDPPALAAHLAACPACAAYLADSSRLDRLWDATRPAPPPGAFASLWAGVEGAAESAPRPAMPRARVRPGLVLRWGSIAAAASLLVAALAWHPREAQVAKVQPAPPPPVVRKVNIDEGQIAVIPVDRREVVTFVAAENPASDEVAPDFDALNEFEAMAAL